MKLLCWPYEVYVPDEQMLHLPIWEGDKVFLRLLQERETFFTLKLVYQGETLVRATLDGERELM